MELFKLFGRIIVDNSDANDAMKYTEQKAQKAMDTFAEMGKEAALMASQMAAAGAAVLGAVGVKSVKASDDFRKSMNLLQAQTGMSSDEMAAFEETAKRLYKSGVGEDFNDIARAMSEITRTTGVTGEELENTSKNALKLRDVFDFDVNESARAANSLMKQFGVSSDEAFALIAQGAQQGANKNGDLLDTLNEYSVQFKSLGFSAEQFTGALIDGAKNGAFSIDKVGDAVKEFNIRSKDGSKTSMSAYEELGMNAEEMTKVFAEGGPKAQTAFQQVAKAIGGIADPVKRNAIGVKLFGTQFEDLESGAIVALGNIQTKTDQTAKTINNMSGQETFGSMFKKIGRQLTVDFFIPLGDKLVPKLQEFGKWMKDNSAEISGGLTKAVKVFGAILGFVVDTVVLAIKYFKILLPILTGITAMIIAQMIIGKIVPMYKAWRAATVGMTIAQAALNAAMALNPFTWIALAIGAVIAAVVAIIIYWDKIVAAAKKTWNWLSSFFKTKIGMIVAFMGGPITIAMMIIANWQKIKKAASNIWGAIVKFFGTVFEKIKKSLSSISDGFKNAFQRIKNAVSSVIDWMKSFLQSKIGKIVAILGGPVTAGLLIIKNWQKIKARASEIWGAVSKRIGDIVNGIKSRVVSIFTAMGDGIKNAWNTAKTNLTNNIQNFATVVKKIFGGIKSAGVAIWDGIKSSVKTVFDWVKGYIEKVINGLKNVFSVFKTFIKDIFDGLVNLIKAPLNLLIGIVNKFIKGYEKVINTVIGAINSIPDIKIPGVAEIGIPDMKKINLAGIPALAEGGTVLRAGTALVGEEGPELLKLPRGAEVRPLDKVTEQPITININHAKILNNKDAAELADRIVSVLKINGIRARGV